jgi:hypothetical protein
MLRAPRPSSLARAALSGTLDQQPFSEKLLTCRAPFSWPLLESVSVQAMTTIDDELKALDDA